MNIHELDSYDLGDAVKFNDKLNPRIWGADERMRPEVREQLLRIADDFREFLGIDVDVEDITVSGSNAAYTYTPHSDIDLHLVVDLPEADRNQVYRELFDAKKYAYNEQHDIRIGGYDVELYVQDANKKHHSQGIYSIKNDDWVSVPKRRRPDVDDISVKSKFEDLGHRIESAIKSGDYERISDLATKLKDYRQAGLDAHGEFGPENLAFKILRTQGLIKKLYDARNEAKDKLLSLDERKKKKKKVRYGYGGYWYPGTAYAGQDHPAGTEGGDGGGDGGGESIREDATLTWDGVNPTTCMFLNEQDPPSDEDILKDFIKFCVAELKIQQMPRVKLRRDPQWPAVHRTFGRYQDEKQTLEVAWGNRHIMDVLRTVAHELTHKRQHEREEVPASAGETGSEYENEANARAGVLMRDWARLHPEHFEAGQAQGLHGDDLKEFSPEGYRQRYSLYLDDYEIDEHFAELDDAIEAVEAYKRDDPKSQYADFNIRDHNGKVVWRNDAWQDLARPSKIQFLPPKGMKESASGYIPTKAQARDPRYSMALTVDIQPGQVGKEANKLKLRTDRQGHPQIARANGLFENLYREYQQFKEFAPGGGRDPGETLKQLASDYYWTNYGPDAQEMVSNPEWEQEQADELADIAAKINALGYQVIDADGESVTLKHRASGKKIRYTEDDLLDEVIQAPVSKLSKADQDYLKFITAKLQRGKRGDQLTPREARFLQDLELKKKLAEFAPSPDRGDDGQGSDYLTQLANRWWNAADPRDQNRIADVIRTFGYEITQVESEDDAVQLTDIQGKDEPIFISADEFDPDLFEGTLPSHISIQKGETWKLYPGSFWVVAIDNDRDRKVGQLLVYPKDGQWIGEYMVVGQEYRRQGVGTAMWNFAEKTVGGPVITVNLTADGKKFQRARKQAVAEDEDLDEVKMSPGALEKFATSPAAKGIRAGFEAELIFRDTQGESDEMDPEPDYDADERCYSIQQVIEFFENDEYGYGLSDRERNRLEENLDETYMEWRDEQIISDFRNDAEDLIRDILLEETPMDQRIHFYLTDSLQMSDEEADAVIKAGAEAPRFTNSTAQKDYADENPEYKAYLEAADEAEQELEESVEFSVNRQDEYWDEALDKYRDDYSGDDDSFFSDVGLRWMSDIANEFNLDWPVWNMDARGNSGSRDWETIGALLQDAVDMPVKVSTNYHSTARREGQWIIEPDGSLSPDDPDDEAGLEIVSPPMPLLTAIEKLRQVVDWANNPKTGNAYTNSSTGLHMGVSLPTMKSEAADDDTGIDYVKLILFMGDKYVQQQFGRTANTYCASALDKLKQNIKGKKSDPAGVVKLLQHGLTELAYKELQKGVGTSKYTSAHIQPGYIEFRSPGGDWLAKADEEIGVLENTMLRFARAMAIAGDPNAERQEYAKKLYKLVTEDNPEYADQLRLFSEFSAGTINKEQLKKQWAETVLQKELPGAGKEEYEVYRRDNGNSPDATVGTLYARDYDDAYDQFLRQYGRDINDLDVRIKQPWFDVFDEQGKIVKTLRAKDIDKATDRAQYEFGQQWTDAWNIYRRPDDTPEPKASPRAQVAKRIVKPQPPAVGDDEASDWEAVYKPTGRVFDTLAHADTAQAKTWLQSAMRDHQFTNVDDILLRRVGHKQAVDARTDSADLQRRLGVRDIETDVAQNFEPDYSAYERNSDRIDAIRARAQQPRQNWELVSDEDPDRVIHRMNDATADEVRAWIAQQEAGGMPAGFLRTRIVAEAIDPVSGAGAVPPRRDPKSIGKKAVDPVDKARLDSLLTHDQPSRGLPYKSAIGNAISQADWENLNQQIQIARKLGDDVNENFADKKVKGKSRPGRVKRAGASCKGSVTDLRARAKKYGGEKGKMYHWCANMKSGRKK